MSRAKVPAPAARRRGGRHKPAAEVAEAGEVAGASKARGSARTTKTRAKAAKTTMKAKTRTADANARMEPATAASGSGPGDELPPLSEPTTIRIRGARTHNLQGVDIDLPRGRLVVITGPSGSGKSSLAFDTIFAEGQRRYVESLSVSARQFLAQLPKPDADLIEGLSPAVAIAQDPPGRNPRSTVGTASEIYDYLRLLFARVGRVYSHRTGALMQRHSIEDMVEAGLGLPEATRFSVVAPVARNAPGDHRELLDMLRRRGFVRVAIDDEVRDLGEAIDLDPLERHSIEVYVDRLVRKEGIRGRLADSIETAVELSGGLLRLLPLDGDPIELSQRHAELEHGITYPEITPSLFSFNSPDGACPRCDGLGQRRVVDPARLVPDERRSLAEGALHPFGGRGGAAHQKSIAAVAKALGASLDTPWRALSAEARVTFIEGVGEGGLPGLRDTFEGARPFVQRRLDELQAKASDAALRSDDDGPAGLEELLAYTELRTCEECEGQRLRLEARMVRVGEHGIHELCTMPLHALRRALDGIAWDQEDEEIASAVLLRVRQRLAFLIEVGLHYLTLDRPMMTLSGGEAQRIRLATQVGAALVGVTYILDEPSVGLHQRDNDRLVRTLLRLRDLGNTVLVVEHDADTMRAADQIVDMGPGAGTEGGRVVAQGSVAEILEDPASLTGAYLSGRREIAVPARRRKPSGASLVLEGACGHNLRDVALRVPLSVLTCVTGVSGSGKSSLVVDTLLPEVRRELNGALGYGLPHGRLRGLRHLDKVIFVDQTPIGRSARSNPATYTGLFSEIRGVFSQLPAAKIRGYGPARFSFNVKGGRCEGCQGEGVRRIEMHFLPDLYVTCSTCGGARYNRETLAVTLRGKTIAEVLALPVAQACDFFVAHPSIRAKLEVLRDVGLGYLALGQSATTLSGGEAQRIKLARELARKSTGNTLFVLDEPTTGLHFSDIEQLLEVLQRLVDEGNTVLVIEHDLDVIKQADHVIDMGPEGGDEGGTIVVSGTPEQVARHASSHTGRYLRRVLRG
ncbi:excinuclease ABC subunit UvrA [Paraliomyxa miuraensis]|uniref:excinuclease ABC subunit UvrA n=1 Tax=Paraliomyxa miuraensis TaxID=376150 RepID=UPI0022527A1E|nr:excinuclease ABC subunit UvrA [Paraliomyxa miuraensis]MCX4239595.1 excinuclease ABC subunit UvrA [Paraliomyxa miuraensis]